ncbi:flagellar motor protein MotB [Ureibacillus endophyticus]|uniref:Flagellar motor protein MotB n=1 Tax=Ureibacillus endophyticus TaxID=1978490 RepID=A0A494Z9X9_9BACL|nr:flagellar motor protein MotB [Lysinibacillus endophyticus]RKQ19389.1 flagellar motor protein MotB [Lysinibacillus endophyticus]
MAKKAKKKKEDVHINESWLLPYSDLMTLLLALFIVLFASSSIDQVKLAKMSAVFNEIFDGGSGFMDQTSMLENPTSSTPGLSEAEKAYIQDQRELKDIQDKVDNFIAVNELEDTFETSMTDEGLLITIRDTILFDPGKADVKSEYIPIADELASLLKMDPARHIVVTGHTDNVPQNGGEFASNWELSVMRAVNILELLVSSNPELDPKYFSAKGYGEYYPIASNETAEGRAKNRRVEVLIQQLVDEVTTKE